ncbi:MAG: Na+/H+ antiporter subunit E [Planctomycetota bacterium]
MSLFIANVLLALIWATVFGEFTPWNFIVGLIVAHLALRLAIRNPRSAYFRKVGTTIALIFFFIKELIVANFLMVKYTLSPLNKLSPGILAVPLKPGMSDLEITVLANMVTLTPGTLSMDVSEDRRALFVHFMHIEDKDAAIRDVKDGFERRLLAVTR